jgi:hypothetical protein
MHEAMARAGTNYARSYWSVTRTYAKAVSNRGYIGQAHMWTIYSLSQWAAVMTL